MEEKTPFGKEANLTGEQGALVLRCPVFCVRNGPLYLRETYLSRRTNGNPPAHSPALSGPVGLPHPALPQGQGIALALARARRLLRSTQCWGVPPPGSNQIR